MSADRHRAAAVGAVGAGGLRFGYGTNGLVDLRLADALALLADLGYDGVALTLDHMHLDPLAPDLAGRTAAVARQLDRLGLAVVVETGARYVLDPRRKHRPSLLDADAGPRLDLLRRAIRVGADLGAEAVSFWSGTLPSTVDPAVGLGPAGRRLRGAGRPGRARRASGWPSSRSRECWWRPWPTGRRWPTGSAARTGSG